MALHHIMEALARIEHKLDALLRWTGVPPPQPMYFVGQSCPACGKMIEYQVDFQHGVVVRRCDCKTGKVPSTFQLLPVPNTGEKNGRPDPAAREAESEHVPQRGEGGRGAR